MVISVIKAALSRVKIAVKAAPGRAVKIALRGVKAAVHIGVYAPFILGDFFLCFAVEHNKNNHNCKQRQKQEHANSSHRYGYNHSGTVKRIVNVVTVREVRFKVRAVAIAAAVKIISVGFVAVTKRYFRRQVR